jgi:superfamily II DNA or RNA helicase
MVSSLNVLQQQALNELQIAHQARQKSGVIIMPTGSGKTRIAAIDAYNFGAKRVLYVAHTHEILDGAAREFEHIFGKESVHRGYIAQDKDISTANVDLVTIQSTLRIVKSLKQDQYDYVVIDEFHHAAAKSYRTLISKIKPKFLLGLTATPFRIDRQDVVDICDGNVLVNFELRTGIDSAILAPYHYYGCFDNVDYSSLDRGVYGYSTKDLDRVLIIPQRDDAIIEKWQQIAKNLPTLAFCCTQKHAQRMVASFRNAGIPAEEYLGSTPLNERSQIIQKLQYGQIKVICAVDVLNEGVDIPFVECLLFLRPTESKRIFYQQLGRGLRKSPGKNKLIVLDFIGNFYNAYRIVEYLGLLPEDQVNLIADSRMRNSKEVLNLPLGCQVTFEDRVIDIFAQQILDPRTVNRNNVARILIYLYKKTSRYLGRRATQRDIDMYQIIHSDHYRMLFGSWKAFEKLLSNEEIL